MSDDFDECPFCGLGEPDEGYRYIHECNNCDEFKGCWVKGGGECCWPIGEPCKGCGFGQGSDGYDYSTAYTLVGTVG